MSERKKITFFMDALHGGGAEKAVVNLLKGLAQRDEFDLDLVLATKEGPYLNQVPHKVRIIDLQAGRAVMATLPLINYLKQNRPWALIGNMGHVNVVATMAKELARIQTRLILVVHNTISANRGLPKRAKLVHFLMKWLYPRADGVAGVSVGVARDLEEQLGWERGTVKVLNNPVVNEELITQSEAGLEHPWFLPGEPPVFLAVGRLSPQKDFPNLLDAFFQLRNQREARLIILGEGSERAKLETIIAESNLQNDVLLPGFVKNPYAYMKRSSCFVLSSRQEGLPTVLIEAMACGCPVVATNCPSGPDEILDGGTYGSLVPIENSQALATAMLEALEHPPQAELLKERANEYSTEKVVTTYLSLLNKVQSLNLA